MKRTNIWLATTLILGGCGALEQAPLVYSSTKQMGLGVKAGAPEAPGLDVNIGFRALDIAYVPVAVAKQCGNATSCSPDYDLQRVHGRSDQSGRSRVDRDRISALRADVEEANDFIAQRSRRKFEIITQLAEAADLPKIDARIAELDGAAIAVPPRALTQEEVLELPLLKAKHARLTALNKASLQGELSKIETDVALKAEKLDTAFSQLKLLLAQRDEESGDAKEDALSVYGTFSGDAAGGQKGGGMKLGNTFSTGVAAQFIAQGLRNAAPTKAVAECIAVGNAFLESDKINQDDKAGILVAIAKACEPKEPIKKP